MIKQGFNYADSTIKEMNDFIETRVENLEPKEDQLPRFPTRKTQRSANEKIATQVS